MSTEDNAEANLTDIRVLVDDYLLTNNKKELKKL